MAAVTGGVAQLLSVRPHERTSHHVYHAPHGFAGVVGTWLSCGFGTAGVESTQLDSWFRDGGSFGQHALVAGGLVSDIFSRRVSCHLLTIDFELRWVWFFCRTIDLVSKT